MPILRSSTELNLTETNSFATENSIGWEDDSFPFWDSAYFQARLLLVSGGVTATARGDSSIAASFQHESWRTFPPQRNGESQSVETGLF